MTKTVRQICEGALQEIGVVGQGKPLAAADASLALERMQLMLDAWQAMRLTIFQVSSGTWNLVQGQQDYTMGPGGDFNVDRPLWLEGANIVWPTAANPPPAEFPMGILTDGEWQRIVVKNLQTNLPRSLWPEWTYPLLTIHVYPIPSLVGLQVKIWTPRPLESAVTLATVLSVPPGYLEAMVYNLASRLVTPFHRQMPASLPQNAIDSLAVVKRANKRIEVALFDPGLLFRGGKYNIYTDTFGTGPLSS